MAKYTDEPPDHSKRMSSEKAFDIHESGVRARPRHYQPIPNQYRSGGHEPEVREGMVWRWGERKTYSSVPAQILFGEMSY